MAIREGRWDCPSCGSRAVYGRHVDCPGCGKPRPAGIRFYLTDDAPAITDAAQLAEAWAGADWVCEHCAASNRATLAECGGCGAARGSSPAQPVIDYATPQVPRSADAPAAGTPVPPTSTDPPAAADLRAAEPTPPITGSDPLIAGSDPPTAQAGPTSLPTIVGYSPPPATAVPDGSAGVWVERREPSATPEELAALIPSEPGLVRRGLKLGGFALAAAIVAVALANLQQAPEPRLSSFIGDPPPRIAPATIIAMRWERDIGIEQRFVDEGTGFTLPDSARVTDEERVVQRYDSVATGYRIETRQVPEERRVREFRRRSRRVNERVRTGSRTYVCGQRDLGNGYFKDRECTEPVYETRTRTEEEDEPYTRTETVWRTVSERVPVYRRVPVYGTRYQWRAPRWRQMYVAAARGDTAAPAWPTPALEPGQRLGTREERYFATVRQAGQPDVEVSLTADEWARHRVGQRVAMHVWYGSLSSILPLDSLPACVHWHAGTGPAPPDSLGCPPLPADTAASPAPRPADGDS